MTAIASRAHAVLNVISNTVKPPDARASARGLAIESSGMTRTGITGLRSSASFKTGCIKPPRVLVNHHLRSLDLPGGEALKIMSDPKVQDAGAQEQ